MSETIENPKETFGDALFEAVLGYYSSDSTFSEALDKALQAVVDSDGEEVEAAAQKAWKVFYKEHPEEKK